VDPWATLAEAGLHNRPTQTREETTASNLPDEIGRFDQLFGRSSK